MVYESGGLVKILIFQEGCVQKILALLGTQYCLPIAISFLQ